MEIEKRAVLFLDQAGSGSFNNKVVYEADNEADETGKNERGRGRGTGSIARED